MNNNCDGNGPHKSGEVRVLPTGGGANSILCRYCLNRELMWRFRRNKDLAPSNRFDLPKWDDLKVYDGT